MMVAELTRRAKHKSRVRGLLVGFCITLHEAHDALAGADLRPIVLDRRAIYQHAWLVCLLFPLASLVSQPQTPLRLADGDRREHAGGAHTRAGLGLSGLAERVTALGGRIEAGKVATDGKIGFRLWVELPIQNHGETTQEERA